MIEYVGEILAPEFYVDFDENYTRVDFVRVQLLWNGDNPLRFQRNFQFSADVNTLLSFKYKRLRSFFQACGHLSHERHDCPLGFDDDQLPAASDDDNDDDGDDADGDDDVGSDPHENAGDANTEGYLGEAPSDDNFQEQSEKYLKRKRVGSSEKYHQESVVVRLLMLLLLLGCLVISPRKNSSGVSLRWLKYIRNLIEEWEQSERCGSIISLRISWLDLPLKFLLWIWKVKLKRIRMMMTIILSWK